MSRFIDLTGQRFGRLVVIKFHGLNYRKKSYWLCKCDCGNEKIVRSDCLRRGTIVSCGCYYRECSAIKIRKIDNTKHGKRFTKIYNNWCSIKARCYNKNNKSYKDYGARGITMCDEWLNDFQAFYDWAMANGYSEHLTIDRIDNEGNYCPENCRWITNFEQQSNKRNNVYYYLYGEKLTAPQIARKYNLNKGTVCSRLKRGWSVEDAIQNKDKRRRKRNND